MLISISNFLLFLTVNNYGDYHNLLADFKIFEETEEYLRYDLLF